jgi:pimeloyl-ACP methyl ester carboxylesterase
MATSLNYSECGKGPAVVLVHGFPLDNRVWDAQVDELSDEYRVIAPDLLGFGKSPSTGPFTIESLADALHEMLGQIGALPCVLGGLSMGGYVSQAYACKYSGDLRGLMLIDTRSTADTDLAKAARNNMMDLAKTKGSSAVADQMMPKLLPPGAPMDVSNRLREIMNACPAQTIQYALAAMRDRPDYGSVLAELQVPTLIIVGELDALAPPSMAEQMHGIIAGSILKVIPGSGHMTPMENPQEVTDTIRDFLHGIKPN